MDEMYPSDTDSSDEEYIPGAAEEATDCELSEESNGDECKEEPKAKRKKESTGCKRKRYLIGCRKRKGGIQLVEEKNYGEIETVAGEGAKQDTYNKMLGEKIIEERAVCKEMEEKKKADDLWADFKADVSQSTTPKTAVTNNSSKSSSGTRISRMAEMLGQVGSRPSEAKKVTVTKEFDFAGEVVRITKEVDATSQEAKEAAKKEESSKVNTGPRLGSTGGLGSILGKIGKKSTISTLDKSKIDWDNFKKEEGIEDELNIHHRGKTGYLERQAFLQRTDVRQYDAEYALRTGKSNNT